MAQIIWADSALSDLDKIIEYIALDKPTAATKLAQQIFSTVEQLEEFPQSGRKPPELNDTQYLEIIVKPCRIFYRFELNKVYILFVMRSERDFRQYLIKLLNE
jgi:toxin ParE1/3/4